MIRKIFTIASLVVGAAVAAPTCALAGVLYPTPNVEVPTPTVSTVGVSRRTISRNSTAAARDFNPIKGAKGVDFQNHQVYVNKAERSRRGRTAAFKAYKREIALQEYQQALLEADRKRRGPFTRRSSDSTAGPAQPATAFQQQEQQAEAKATAYQQRAQQAARAFFSSQAHTEGGVTSGPGQVADAKPIHTSNDPGIDPEHPAEKPAYQLPGTPLVNNSSLSGPGARNKDSGQSTFWTRLSSVFSDKGDKGE